MALWRSLLPREHGRAVMAGLADDDGMFQESGPDLWVFRTDERCVGLVNVSGKERVLLAASSESDLDALEIALSERFDVPRPVMRSVQDFVKSVESWLESGGGGETWVHLGRDVTDGVRTWFSHWSQCWLDMPMTRLGDMTPREAVRHPAYRAHVDAMLGRFDSLRGFEEGGLLEQTLESLRAELSPS